MKEGLMLRDGRGLVGVVGCEAVKVLKEWRGAAQLTYRTGTLD